MIIQSNILMVYSNRIFKLHAVAPELISKRNGKDIFLKDALNLIVWVKVGMAVAIPIILVPVQMIIYCIFLTVLMSPSL